MRVDNEKLKSHIDHHLELVWCGQGENVWSISIVCSDCKKVIAYTDMIGEEDD